MPPILPLTMLALGAALLIIPGLSFLLDWFRNS